MNNKYKSVSLFSGAMGLDLGLELAGFQTQISVEKWAPAVKTIRKNKPYLPVINSPIEFVSSEEILSKSNLKKGDISLISGGPSCQSFSTAGKRESLSDNRGMLFKDYCRIISELQPRFFVMENVPGILSAAIKHRPLNRRGPGHPRLSKEEEFGSALKVILNEFQKLNYYIVFGVLNSADFGVPQKRKRVIFIGSRDGEEINFPIPTHSEFGYKNTQNWVSIKEALKNTKSKNWLKLSEKDRKYLSYLKAGENWKDLPIDLQKIAIGGAYESWGGRSGFLRRLDWNKPAPSLTTSPTGRATMLCHPSELRPLSIEEYAKIQQFPEDYYFEGSINQIYAMIGNAVPVGLGRAIGQTLIQTIKKSKIIGNQISNFSKKGLILCVDNLLCEKLNNQVKTQLPPSKYRKITNSIETKHWLGVNQRKTRLYST